jgi:Transglycosylase-like domain/Putative peptidoglycan binding domain
MIVHTPHTQRTAARTRRLAARAAIATALALLTPVGAAHATGGGVAIGSSTTSATAASAPADVAPQPTTRPRSVGKTQLRRAQTLLRLSVTGRHDATTRKVVARFQGLRGIAPSGIVDLPTYLQIRDAFALLQTGGLAIEATGTSAGGATTAASQIRYPANLAPITDQERALLDKIGQCESKGDPTVISANGKFRGKYQFDLATWRSVGGTGDPAAATEDEQDQRAAILLRQRGTAPWPVCGA